jgi:spectinomycin phosphotransferase
MTAAQWSHVGATFRRIHEAALPPEGFAGIRSERFDPSEYATAVTELGDRFAQPPGDSPAEHEIRSLWVKYRSVTDEILVTMREFAEALQGPEFRVGVCHADLHAANLLRDRPEHAYVIDWDDVMLAPKERDLIFVRDQDDPEGSPFFDGYGQADVDWGALAYYRYERVITDLIAYAQEAMLPDLSAETKAESVRRFVVNLEGPMIRAARSAGERV